MNFNDNYFDIPVKINNPLEQRIFEAFCVYDHNAVNMVDGRDIGAVVRSLGCIPTEAEVQEIIRQTEFHNHPGEVHLSYFMPHLKGLLAAHKMKPSNPEDLFDAFKFLDLKNKGFIEKETFRNLLTEFGESMSKEELSDMMKSAVDPTDDRIYYENYINQLIYNPEDSIYDLADEFATLGPRASQIKLNTK